MDFLDPKKRKAHRIKLFIGYGLMAVALTFASIILLYQSYGFDFDAKTGQIVQNGFVFVDAKPAGADIYLNGEPKGRTSRRLDIRAGDYTLELQQTGYRSWKRAFNLEAGKVEQFVYPMLFPTNLQTGDAKNYATTPAFITQTPDRQRLLVQQPGSLLRFDLIDITGDSAESEIVDLPAALVTAAGATHEFKLVEWSTDNRRLVISHRHDAGTEFIMFDTESPAASLNLSREFDVPFTALALRDKDYDRYYLHDTATGNLYAAEVDAQAELFQAGVLAFRPHGNEEVAFITAAGADAGKVWLRIREGREAYSVRQLPAGSRYLVDLARFNNSWYVVAGTAEQQKAYLFKNPVAEIKRDAEDLPLPVAVLRTPGNGEFVSFSANTRFVALQSGSDFAVYDAETDRQYRYDAGLELTPGQRVEWMDGHRLAAVAGGFVNVMDYDGTNRQTLTAALPGSTPMFHRDYEAMFTLSATALVRTALRVQP